jgi:hypothetical protein
MFILGESGYEQLEGGAQGVRFCRVGLARVANDPLPEKCAGSAGEATE